MQNQTRNLVIVALVAALVVVTCWNQSTGQVAPPPAKPAVVKWEYKLEMYTTNSYGSRELDKLGVDGWEAFAVYPYEANNEKVFFKRPVAAK